MLQGDVILPAHPPHSTPPWPRWQPAWSEPAPRPRARTAQRAAAPPPGHRGVAGSGSLGGVHAGVAGQPNSHRQRCLCTRLHLPAQSSCGSTQLAATAATAAASPTSLPSTPPILTCCSAGAATLRSRGAAAAGLQEGVGGVGGGRRLPCAASPALRAGAPHKHLRLAPYLKTPAACLPVWAWETRCCCAHTVCIVFAARHHACKANC